MNNNNTKAQAVIRYETESNIGRKERYVIDVVGNYKNISHMVLSSDVYCITLFNDALDVVKKKFKNFPYIDGTDSIQYHGDFARFIVANIGEV